MRQPGMGSAIVLGAFVSVFVTGASLLAAELEILLPLDRAAYQTNERIDVSVVRSSPQPLAANDLVMAVSATDGSGSRMSFTFPVGAVPVTGNAARATEHFYLNGTLLSPGRYKLEVSADGASANREIEIGSHVRNSTFKLIAWGSTAKSAEQQAMGEDSLGFNLLYAHAPGDDSILGGVDWMQCCTQGGGHQLARRLECDWSDPYAIRGGAAKLSQAAFYRRRSSNAIGVHFYDEPGLTWHNHPETGEMTPHDIPAQVRAFKSAFGGVRALTPAVHRDYTVEGSPVRVSVGAMLLDEQGGVRRLRGGRGAPRRVLRSRSREYLSLLPRAQERNDCKGQGRLQLPRRRMAGGGARSLGREMHDRRR